MFQETLLESSPNSSRQRRWPVATAFTMQLLVAGVLVIIPLLSTAILPLKTLAAPPPVILARAPADAPRPTGGPSSGHHVLMPINIVALIANNGRRIYLSGGPSDDGSNESKDALPPCYDATCVPGAMPAGPQLPTGRPPVSKKNDDDNRPVRLSHMDEGLLIHKVIPSYPRLAALSNVQGVVTMHAIIARDGTIQSLSVINGPPLLTGAALDAVRQWKYRPYVLNGDPVEVETYITVNFKRN